MTKLTATKAQTAPVGLGPGGSVNSMVSDVSIVRLPVTTSGYFSNPRNFPHFVECAQSYLCPGPGESLATEDAISLKVIFEGAAQLGVFDYARARSRRVTWQEKLWALGAYWGIKQTPGCLRSLDPLPKFLKCQQSIAEFRMRSKQCRTNSAIPQRRKKLLLHSIVS